MSTSLIERCGHCPHRTDYSLCLPEPSQEALAFDWALLSRSPPATLSGTLVGTWRLEDIHILKFVTFSEETFLWPFPGNLAAGFWRSCLAVLKLYSSEHNTAEVAVAVTMVVQATDIWSHHSMMLAPPKGIFLNLKSMLGLEEIRHFIFVRMLSWRIW